MHEYYIILISVSIQTSKLITYSEMENGELMKMCLVIFFSSLKLCEKDRELVGTRG